VFKNERELYFVFHSKLIPPPKKKPEVLFRVRLQMTLVTSSILRHLFLSISV